MVSPIRLPKCKAFLSELAQMAGRYSGSAKGEANGAQEAEVQAKKRVCAEAVMLGLFFYFLPKVWAKGERVGKDFFFEKGEQQRAVYEMYRRAGLTVVHRPSITIPDDPPSTGSVAAFAGMLASDEKQRCAELLAPFLGGQYRDHTEQPQEAARRKDQAGTIEEGH